ncbi:sugar ABC transporter permease [Stackebrandtia nassauensis]|uniref:Binding-protein-dependent transport systems inner membrane component n=1 Tax=Stackebrandtia nassauensis (strain DSM 44728 / CIP 108903 / NRRL B-16338 / NBRC 102104 / LLR-40K-21) TaxID=446470 RepID=D3PZ88_STANL|nr:ABC transporter permease subunit [Stackebrandtia nassauensis]ADD45517.1 binding-protein-dependent transport systems inner membrane component [Stackebrandtia nassauensis DSM 44728]
MSSWLRIFGWRHVVAIAVAVFSLVPIVFVVSSAFNPVGTLSSTTLLPENGFSFDNLTNLFTQTEFASWYGNTLLIAFVAAAASVFISALAAYAFSRFRFRGRRVSLLALLLIQMFPQFLAIVAIYLIFSVIGDRWPVLGFNTSTGLILVYLGGAMGVNTWLMKGFFDTVPKELDESAIVDGATHAQVFFRIILPLVTPILAISGLLAFVGIVNEYIIASVFLTDPESQTLAVGLAAMVGDNNREANFGMFCAGTVLTAIPTVAVFTYLQRYIVHGLTAGAVKG